MNGRFGILGGSPRSPRYKRAIMRIVITGQVGLDKKNFLRRVEEKIHEAGRPVTVCTVGEMMYREAPDVAPGRILDLPLARLESLRRSVFKDILNVARKEPNVLINTHAIFRWRHGLFYAFDYDQMKELDADLYLTLVDNIDCIHAKLVRDGHADHSLKDLMVWREEELMATEMLSKIVAGHGRFFLWSRGQDYSTADALARCLLHPEIKMAYLSFPMSHVLHLPELMERIAAFRDEMKKYFICFDPGDVEEKYLCDMALNAAAEGRRSFEAGPADNRVSLETKDVLDIFPDIDGQIYARDFKLIDQSDMIISLIPELEGGRPGLSSGVERELQHAHEATKEVYVIWQPKAEPSPFITETATRVFRSIEAAIEYLSENRYRSFVPVNSLFGPISKR